MTSTVLENKNLLVSQGKNTLQYQIKGSSGKKELEYHTIVVPKFGEWMLILPDGSKVWLNSGSSLKYPVTFPDHERKVFLTGEAYFEISQDRDKPFIANTEKIDTKVLGTTFNIRAYPNENLSITLAEGSISLLNKITNSTTKLEPNDNATLMVSGSEIMLNKVDAGKHIAWKSGFYYFEREKLTDILSKLQMWYDFQVVYKDPVTENFEFKMRADRNLGFGQIVKRLEDTGRIKVKIIENTIYIYDVERK
jgi:hypothetical protein